MPPALRDPYIAQPIIRGEGAALDAPRIRRTCCVAVGNDNKASHGKHKFRRRADLYFAGTLRNASGANALSVKRATATEPLK